MGQSKFQLANSITCRRTEGPSWGSSQHGNSRCENVNGITSNPDHNRLACPNKQDRRKTSVTRSHPNGHYGVASAAGESAFWLNESAFGDRASVAQQGRAQQPAPADLQPGQPRLPSLSDAGAIHREVRPNRTG